MKSKQQRPKHVPQRSCIVCRQKTDKRRLTRLVRTVEGTVLVDPTGKQNGRGAYLCDQSVCWDKALNSQLLKQILGVQLTAETRESIAAFRPET